MQTKITIELNTKHLDEFVEYLESVKDKFNLNIEVPEDNTEEVHELIDELCESNCRAETWKNNPNYCKFIEGLLGSDYIYDLREYKGRFWYDGPAVVTSSDNFSEIAQLTGVKLQQDNMGLDVVIYPK